MLLSFAQFGLAYVSQTLSMVAGIDTAKNRLVLRSVGMAMTFQSCVRE